MVGTAQNIDRTRGVMERAEIIRAREEEVGREWEWLQEAINLVARARTGEEDADFRLLQHHAMDIGQRRVELMLELAKLERPSGS